MVQIVWSERAIIDLNSIAEYIASDSEYAANKFVKELIKRPIYFFLTLKWDVLFLKISLIIIDKFFIRAIELFTNWKIKT